MSKETEKIISDAINEHKKEKKIEKEKPRLYTGSTLRDLVLGGAKDVFGIQTGVIWNSIGDSSAGKCIKNSYILTENGFELIDDLGKDKNIGINQYKDILLFKKDKFVTPSIFYKEKVKKTIKIRTRHGFEIEGTPEHKIKILNKDLKYEMISLSELKDKEVCIIEYDTNIFNKNEYYFNFKFERKKYDANSKEILLPNILNEDLSYILGLFVADGNFTDCTLFFNNIQKWFKDNLNNKVKNIFNIQVNKNFNIDSVMITSFFKYIFDYPENFTARYKYIPKCIMQGKKENQIAFLQGLIDCDSWYDKKMDIGCLEYYTASEKLSKQVQLLLLNMGILSSRISQLGAKVGDKFYNHVYHTIRISSIDLLKYFQIIGSYKYDFSKMKSNKCKRHSNFDYIPFLLERMKVDKDNLRKKLGWLKNGKLKNLNIRFPNFSLSKKVIVNYSFLTSFINTFEIFKEYFDLDFYKQILKDKFHYDFIIEIQELNNEVFVYDVHIPENHLFWANGFINHNTFECCELIATNKKIYKDKFKFNYDNAEGGNTIDSQILYGFDIITDKTLISRTVEELFINVHKFVKELKEDELGCYVVDSLDALSSKEVVERGENRIKAFDKGKEFDEGSYIMGKQKYLAQEFFPIIKPLIEKSNCLLIIISQEKEKIGVTFGSRSTRAGGKALEYFSHFISWLARAEKLEVTKKGETRVIGIRNKMRFTKARNSRPFRDSFATIYFDYGISDIDSNVDFLFNLLTDSGKDSTKFNVEFKDQIFKSKKELIAYIEENNLEEEIKRAVIEKWELIEESVKIKRKGKY